MIGFVIGNRVAHPDYGPGTITYIDYYPDGDIRFIAVEFDDGILNTFSEAEIFLEDQLT